MVELTAFLLSFFSLIEISLNQPTNFEGVDDRRIAEKSYDLSYRRSGNGFDASGQRNTPFLQRSHHHDPRHHAWGPRHDYYFQRKYDDTYRGKTYLPTRIHSIGQGDNSEILSRRTVDVGIIESSSQLLGNGVETKRKRKLKRETIEDVKINSTAALNVTEGEESVEEMEKGTGTGRMIKMGQTQMGNSGKRPGIGSRSSTSHRNPTRRKPMAPKRNTTKNTDFVFPDQRLYEPNSTGCGENLTFCEDTDDDYPREHIRQLLKKEGERFKEVFGRDSILEMNVTERIFKDETELCVTSQRLVFPTKAKNKDDKWQFVVNQDKFTQGIMVEICIDPDKPCTMTSGFPQSYRSICRQKFISRRLLSINESGGAGMSEFLFPSCCVCMLQFIKPGPPRPKTG